MKLAQIVLQEKVFVQDIVIFAIKKIVQKVGLNQLSYMIYYQCFKNIGLMKQKKLKNGKMI